MAKLDNILTSSNYSSYFKGELYLDIDFDGTGDVDTSKITELDNIVTDVQYDLFKELFGEALYNYLYDNREGTVYTALRDGETITASDNYKYVWEGLKSMLSYYVYYEYKKEKEGFDTPLGEKFGNSVNSSSARNSLNYKLKRAWNKGVDLYRDAIDYIDYKNEQSTDYYPEFLPTYNKYYLFDYGL